MEQALKESEERFRTLIEKAPGPVAISLEGITTYVNSGYLKLFGFDQSREVLGHPLIEQIAPQCRAEIKERIRRRENGLPEPEAYETVGLRKGGSQFPLWAAIASVNIAERPATLAFLTDISSVRQTQELLKESEQKYRTLFEEMVSGFALHEIVLDEQGTPVDYVTLEVNREYEKLLNIARDHVVGKRAYQITPGLDREWLDIFGSVILTGQARRYVQFASNLEKWFEGQAFRISPTRFAVTFVDISEHKQAEKLVEENLLKYRFLADNISDVVSILNLENGKWEYVSPSVERLLGFTINEAMKRTPRDVMSADSYVQFTKLMKENLARCFEPGPSTVHFDEIELKRRDGTTVWTEIATRFFTNSKNEPIVLGVSRDISQRKFIETKLKESEIKFRTVADYTFDWEYWMAPDGRFNYVTPSCQRVTGYKREEFMQNPGLLAEIIHPEDRSKVVNHPRSQKQDADSLDFRIITRSGEMRWISHHCQSVYSAEGLWLGQRASNRDITERMNIEHDLAKSQERLSQFTLYLQEAIESEKRNLSHEIHDELGQLLTGLKIDLDWLNRRLPANAEPLREKLKSMSSIIEQAEKVVKNITADLRPILLDDLGLVEALKWLVSQFSNRTGIKSRLKINPEDMTLDPKRSLDVYRVVQEVLTNITRHARANLVTISLSLTKGRLDIQIKDNGIGLAPENIDNPHSFGLIGIKERVRRWKGTAEFKGVPGKGTQIELSIPVDGEY